MNLFPIAREQLHETAEPAQIMMCVSHDYLGESTAISMINQIGSEWQRSAVLWKWGAAFQSSDSSTQASAEIEWSPLPGKDSEFGGMIRVSAWGAMPAS